MLLFNRCIPNASSHNYDANNRSDKERIKQVLALAQLLAVPDEYRNLVLTHELRVSHVFDTFQVSRSLENMIGLDVARYLAEVGVDERVADDAWAFAHQWLEDAIVLRYISREQVEPYLKRARMRNAGASRPPSMVRGPDIYCSEIICPAMPMLIGQPLAPPALWPLDAEPPDCHTEVYDEDGNRFYPSGPPPLSEPLASTPATTAMDVVASGDLLTAAAPTSESPEPSTKENNLTT
jgi:hypothetical protein